MNALHIILVVTAACCASQGRNIPGSRRFVNQPSPGLISSGNNHLDIQALMTLLRNPVMMKRPGQVNSQQQQQQQQQQGTGQIPQAEVTPQLTPNQGQPQPEPLPTQTKPQNSTMTHLTQNQGQGQTSAQTGGQGQQGQTNNGQMPVQSPTANTPRTLDPMQQFMGYSNMFTDPMFLQYFQQFMRRVNRIKPKYRKGDFIPAKGLFHGGYVISADGSDAEVRDIYGKLHTIDGGVFQA